MNVKKLILMANIYNTSFKTRFYEFIYLTILGLIISIPLSLITNDFWAMSIFLMVISIILSLTTIRLSNAVIYSKITKHISMNVLDFNEYHSKKYLENKKEIAQIFSDEFIEGIIRAYDLNCKKIRMTTHEWVYKNVLLDERVLSRYSIEIKEKGMCKIPFEVLLLANKSYVLSNSEIMLKEAYRERKQYYIVLKKKC